MQGNLLTLLEQKILLITGFAHIRLVTQGSIEFSAVNQQAPKEGVLLPTLLRAGQTGKQCVFQKLVCFLYGK